MTNPNPEGNGDQPSCTPAATVPAAAAGERPIPLGVDALAPRAAIDRSSLASNVHEAIGAIREQARDTARQLMAQAEDALIESLRTLNTSGRAPSTRDADTAPRQGEQA
ncbi:hypothetical protein WT97_06695 [Burkholderia sp. MSMB1459WGS]|uniref:hypothetical protein n=1 Tax=Burkholderia sp. MSMB1459WGS TaxID=1637970 RepID=UPI00075F8E39|nr:hypothetical protein [Burkholderia sp. MSMB1459WGS]KWO47757.1 hypothetical protein WT97_06695 [Burkholderia sp. MSMB1459WGS]